MQQLHRTDDYKQHVGVIAPSAQRKKSISKRSLPLFVAIALSVLFALSPIHLVTASTSGWSAPTRIDNTTTPELSSVSCTSNSFCMAVDGKGNALKYSSGSWTTYASNPVDSSVDGLSSVSC